MKITEKITRDCCRVQDLVKVGENSLERDIFQCKHCKKKKEEVWCGPGNNDFLLKDVVA